MKIPGTGSSKVYASAKVLPVVALILIMAACAPSPVKDTDKDTSGAYDGKWSGIINRTPTNFTIQNWRIRCYNMAGKMDLSITQGRIFATWQRNTYTGFVNSKGKFRIEIPSTFKFRQNAAHSSDLNRSSKYFIDGALGGKNAKGRLTHGFGDFGYQGCSSSIKFNRV